MTISYKWLSEYLPVTIEPERLSKILTSVGLEVESLEKYEEIKGGLKGLVVGKVLEVEKHPNADKLKLTKVDVGTSDPLSIVCGAPNVAAGQTVIVAEVGVTIYPVSGEPMTMRVARIRGVESNGMICAEDEIGIGSSHEGIMVLPDELKAGSSVAEYFKPYEDWIYEIGLTPNRMDAMSHWGVARDICAYLSHHDKKEIRPRIPVSNGFKVDNTSLTIDIKVENTAACPRYSGISISNVTIAESPEWLKQKLRSIGSRPINNLVDITNFILHETGQPLHAFDADAIAGKKVIVKDLPEKTIFITLDEKERKLNAEDLMICNAEEGMCIAGVFGGLHSGVTSKTKNVFLESACFDPVTIRRTSFRHGLRTDAATRFEKGTDISATVTVLKRAATLIRDICGGIISSEIVDIYPNPKEKSEITLKYHYLKKLSGKNYHPDAVKSILIALGFEIRKEGIDEIRVAAPYHKPDISLPADIVEEILRIDGLDNIEIPKAITITPSIEENHLNEVIREKVSGYLTGLGFNEIMTNSITNASYFSKEELENMVKMINSLTAELNILRSSLFETALETVAHNLNHKNNSLKLFEFGKSYSTSGPDHYLEAEKLCILISGNTIEQTWKHKEQPADLFFLKGIMQGIFQLMNIHPDKVEITKDTKLDDHMAFLKEGNELAALGKASKASLGKFDIKQPVFYSELNWTNILQLAEQNTATIKELPRFPSVQRDLAIVLANRLKFEEVENSVQNIRLDKLQELHLFDIFESEKLGTGKKSMAISFTFRDDEKTLTDKEIDGWMNKIMLALEKDLNAEIRK